MTRLVVPRIHGDYDLFGLNDVLERWNKYHLNRLPADVDQNQLESFLVECLAEKGIVIDPRLLELKKEGIDLLKVSDIPGTTLIEIEREKLGFIWRWADYLFPDWGYWLEFPTLTIEAAVYLASDIDPSFSDARKRNPPYDEQNLHYKSWFDEPMIGKEWRYIRPMIEKRVESRLQVAAMNFERFGGELQMALPEKGFLGMETPVLMRDFVKWAIDCKDWELPQELEDRFYESPVQEKADFGAEHANRGFFFFEGELYIEHGAAAFWLQESFIAAGYGKGETYDDVFSRYMDKLSNAVTQRQITRVFEIFGGKPDEVTGEMAEERRRRMEYFYRESDIRQWAREIDKLKTLLPFEDACVENHEKADFVAFAASIQQTATTSETTFLAPDKAKQSIPTPYDDNLLYERKIVGRYLKYAFPERFTGDAQLTFDSLTVVDVPYQKVVSIGGVGNPNYRKTATRHRYCLKGCDINQFISDFLIQQPHNIATDILTCPAQSGVPNPPLKQREPEEVPSSSKESQLHNFIWSVYCALESAGQLGSNKAKSVWDEIKNNHDEYDNEGIIQEVADEYILWKSKYGSEQKLKYTSFSPTFSSIKRKMIERKELRLT